MCEQTLEEDQASGLARPRKASAAAVYRPVGLATAPLVLPTLRYDKNLAYPRQTT